MTVGTAWCFLIHKVAHSQGEAAARKTSPDPFTICWSLWLRMAQAHVLECLTRSVVGWLILQAQANRGPACQVTGNGPWVQELEMHCGFGVYA